MNPFKSFQPGKSKSISTEAASSTRVASSEPVPKKVSLFKSLLSKLNDDPFDLSISTTDANGSAIGSKKVNYETTRLCYLTPSDVVPGDNLSLCRQFSIEANFDITPILSESITREGSDLNKTQSYIYPSSQKEHDSQHIADYVASNLSRPRHWTARELEIPYLGQVGHSDGSTSANGSGIMIGKVADAVSSSVSTKEQVEGQLALAAVQSRLLKWQEALHALLRDLLRAHSAGNRGGSPMQKDKSFYVIGRSVALPPSAKQGGASSSRGALPLPYTSAVFHLAPTRSTTSTDMTGSSINDTVSYEPACIIVGAHRHLVQRLQQLGAVCLLVEDVNSPLPLSKAEASNRGKSAVISIAQNKNSADPHASTSAVFNSKKLGVDILLRGKFDLSVAAQVLKESVFDVLQQGNRANPADVPVLFAGHSFPHALAVSYDRRPVLCQHEFAAADASSGVVPVASVTLEKNPTLEAAVHKIQLTGLLTTAQLPAVIAALHKCAAASAAGPAVDAPTRRGRQLSSAYAYLRNRHDADAAAVPSSTGNAQSKALPELQPIGANRNVATSAAGAAPLNPMTLVTANARSYALTAEEDGDYVSESEETGQVGDDHAVESHSGLDEQDSTASAIRRSAVAADAAGSEEVASPGAKRKLNGNAAFTSAAVAVTGSAAGAARTARSPGRPAGVVPRAVSSSTASNLRTEEWLRLQRESPTSKYFHIQCWLLTPRAAQFSYAQTASGRVTPGSETTELDGFTFALQPAGELVEEVRWSSALSSAGSSSADMTVEVVSTAAPPARLRGVPAEDDEAALLKPQTAGEETESGMVLEALNKYTIYVENKAL